MKSKYFLTSPEINPQENFVNKNRSHSSLQNHSKSLILPKQNSSKDSIQKEYNPEGFKLPFIGLKKILNKIGAATNRENSYIPPEQEQKIFRRNKIKQLKDQYSPPKKQNKNYLPFAGQLDEIVLDCYRYGQSHGHNTVWRKYRQNMYSLSYDTMKILNKKKR